MNSFLQFPCERVITTEKVEKDQCLVESRSLNERNELANLLKENKSFHKISLHVLLPTNIRIEVYNSQFIKFYLFHMY